MASTCSECGKRMSFLSLSSICPDCKEVVAARKQAEEDAERMAEEEREAIGTEIINSRSISDKQLDIVQRLKKKSAINLYNKIYAAFIKDAELEHKEIETLLKIQNAANLSNDEILYKENVLPYAYVSAIKIDGKLPTPEIQIPGASPIILKKGEVPHFGDLAVLKETRTVTLGYKGGSRGISIKIMKGVSYRVGAHRGEIQREEKLIEISRGALILTNQRVYLHPLPGCKPVSIPLNKILSYNCFRDAIEIYKDGRERGYLFYMNSGAVEIAGICLNFLLTK